MAFETSLAAKSQYLKPAPHRAPANNAAAYILHSYHPSFEKDVPEIRAWFAVLRRLRSSRKRRTALSRDDEATRSCHVKAAAGVVPRQNKLHMFFTWTRVRPMGTSSRPGHAEAITYVHVRTYLECGYV